MKISLVYSILVLKNNNRKADCIVSLFAQFIMCTDLSGNSECETAFSVLIKDSHLFMTSPNNSNSLIFTLLILFDCQVDLSYIGLNNKLLKTLQQCYCKFFHLFEL